MPFHLERSSPRLLLFPTLASSFAALLLHFRYSFADIFFSQHLQKLKRKEGAGPTPGSSAKKTPASRGKKRIKTIATADDDDDDDDMEPTPSKKPAHGKKAAAVVPVEEEKLTLKPIKNEQYASVYPAVSTLPIMYADSFLLFSEDSDKDAV